MLFFTQIMFWGLTLMNLHVIILAAGMSKRMHSNTPKIMHKIGATPMLEHVFNAALGLNPAQTHVIVSPNSDLIKQSFSHLNINWIEQKQQLGTGHALLQALPSIPNDAYILVLCADNPLLKTATIKPLVEKAINRESICLLLAHLDNPFGLGRILRNENSEIISIVEEKDASNDIKLIHEIYTGICCASINYFKLLLPKVTNDNAQNEYYLTDIVKLAVKDSIAITSVTAEDPEDVLGVNDRLQLQTSERIYQKRIAKTLLTAGVSVADINRIDIRGTISCGKDIFIDINNIFYGNIVIDDNTIIGPNCTLTDVTIGQGCYIYANSVLEDCTIGDNCHIGPFARIRPGTKLDSDCRIGNFVEIKNTTMAHDSKANHLSYLGDATIGSHVNIGAGTITCNYDGANKHQTIIEDNVHIGSDTQLVAPIRVGENATVGAGSTIRKDVVANELTLTTSTQKTIYGWKRPRKKAELS
jgi:bifunctional UDP-N-acetylglucosamine pyrophosphorylase/glucosamine-1-phosphate N-acetyltransferase